MRRAGWWGTSLMVLLAVTGCTKVTTVPPSGYRDPEQGLTRYRVHTTSGVTYYVSDFTADDSTLTVLRFRHLHNEDVPPPPAPFTLPLAEVKSVEKIGPSDETPLILGGIFLIFAGLAAAAASVGCDCD